MSPTSWLIQISFTHELLRDEAHQAEMTSDAARKWDKKIIVRITSMQLGLLNKNHTHY